MIAILHQEILPCLLSLLLITATIPQAGAVMMYQEQQSAPAPSSGYTGQGAPETAQYVINRKMTGGFAVVAYPAQYGDSGIMTFIINQNGPAYAKDLGKTTTDVASAMTEFNPDKSWKVVE